LPSERNRKILLNLGIVLLCAVAVLGLFLLLSLEPDSGELVEGADLSPGEREVLRDRGRLSNEERLVFVHFHDRSDLDRGGIAFTETGILQWEPRETGRPPLLRMYENLRCCAVIKKKRMTELRLFGKKEGEMTLLLVPRSEKLITFISDSIRKASK
jgi:hypothetical protein